MSKNKKVIIGIDPGIADTGVGIIEIEGSKMKCLGYTSIKTSSKTDFPDRLEKLAIELDVILKKYKPDLVSIEQLFFCNNVKTALIVGQARGAAVLTVKKNKIKIVEFTPLQIKQAVAAYGAATKKQVQKMVQNILNLKEIPKPDDAADALAAAICATNSLNSLN